MPSAACQRGLFSGAWLMSLGLCGADGRRGQSGNRAALATDGGKGSGPRQLWPHSSPSLALCLIFWEKRACSLFRSHHATFIGAQGVKKDAPGFTFSANMVVQKNQAPSLPHSQPRVQPEKLHAVFEWNICWKDSTLQWCLESQRTSQCVSSSNLHPLMVHEIYWVYDLGQH